MPRKNYSIAIFASGSGTNAEKIFQYYQHHPLIEVVALLSNDPKAYALQRAKNAGIATLTFCKQEFKEQSIVLDWLLEKEVTHIVLAGFLWLVPLNLLQAFPDRIINIHPALLPKFGGKGMYGINVHQAVKLSGDTHTGITIHEVNERYDEGQIILQASCSVTLTDTIDQIADKVHALEHAHYAQAIEKWILET